MSINPNPITAHASDGRIHSTFSIQNENHSQLEAVIASKLNAQL